MNHINCTLLDEESDSRSNKENSKPFSIGQNPFMRQIEKHSKRIQDASADISGFNLAPSSHGAKTAEFGNDEMMKIDEEQEVSVLDQFFDRKKKSPSPTKSKNTKSFETPFQSMRKA